MGVRGMGEGVLYGEELAGEMLSLLVAACEWREAFLVIQLNVILRNLSFCYAGLSTYKFVAGRLLMDSLVQRGEQRIGTSKCSYQKKVAALFPTSALQ